jgi:hypothetical protein
VSDIVVLEVQDPLGVLDDGGSVGRNEELDRLGHAVVGKESPRLGSSEVGVVGGSVGNGEERRVALEVEVG